MLFALIQIGALSIAFDKLGLSMSSAMLLLMSSLLGSGINLPLFTIDARGPQNMQRPQPPAWLNAGLPLREGKVLVAMNVGGGLLPIAFSAYLLANYPLPLGTVALAIAIQAAVCFAASRPIPRLGIGMPILLAPITAALIAVLLLPEQSPPLAYVCGTMGVLIGADLLRLKDVRGLGSPFASIGGAGTFDGVFVTGIVAVLLA
ncbi:DUF1614 domain-containing protein [Ectothiorhodospiraceae bacterium WFHF3C12]|nr:DUF1614 domain-containing protein [Ectothiorhodospiraceae bacterium WFHF3C12]